MENQRRLGPSMGQMAWYGVRVQLPRDHRRGWAHPYERPGDHGKQSSSGKGGGKGKSKGVGKSSSSSSGQGAGTSPYPSRERESATNRIQRLSVSKWDRSPNSGDTSRGGLPGHRHPPERRAARLRQQCAGPLPGGREPGLGHPPCGVGTTASGRPFPLSAPGANCRCSS